MKNKLLKTSLISLIIIMLLQVASFAAVDKLTLKTLTDKDTYTVGDKVTVTIDWTEKMECAEFNIKFDSTKLEFEKATYSDGRTLKEDFTNIVGEGNLKFGYFGDESTKMLFIFEAKATGKTTISVSDPSGFADGNLDEPSSYDTTTYGSKEITINVKAEDKPDGGTDTEDNNTPTNPDEGTNTGNNTTTKPSEGTNTGNNTTTKPSEGTNTGNNTTTKPSEGTNTGNNTTTKPNKDNNTVDKTTTSNKVDNTTASGKMPQTGSESVVFIIVLVTAVGIIGFVKYRGLSDI